MASRENTENYVNVSPGPKESKTKNEKPIRKPFDIKLIQHRAKKKLGKLLSETIRQKITTRKLANGKLLKV